MSDTVRRGTVAPRVFARVAALSGASGKVCPADRATAVAERSSSRATA